MGRVSSPWASLPPVAARWHGSLDDPQLLVGKLVSLSTVADGMRCLKVVGVDRRTSATYRDDLVELVGHRVAPWQRVVDGLAAECARVAAPHDAHAHGVTALGVAVPWVAARHLLTPQSFVGHRPCVDRPLALCRDMRRPRHPCECRGLACVGRSALCAHHSDITDGPFGGVRLSPIRSAPVRTLRPRRRCRRRRRRAGRRPRARRRR